MAIVKTDDKHYKDIADKIREKTRRDAVYKPSEMSDGIEKAYKAVHDVGYAQGEMAGLSTGYYNGEKAEYDRFWDDFQQNGNRTVYTTAFGGCWTEKTFRPKYPIRPTSAYMMFFTNMGGGIEIDDFVAFCEENNIVLDFSECTNCNYALGTLHTYHHGVLNFSKATGISNLFYTHDLNTRSVETIDEWITSDITTYSASTFQHAIKLTNVTFSGVIAKGTVDFSKCTKLSKASITSIINALSTITSGLAVTLSQTAVNNAFTSDEWSALIATKSNWTISLV